MRKWFEYGGAVAAIVLIVFGVVAIVMGVNGRNTVRDSLKQEADRRNSRHEQDGNRGRGQEGRPPRVDQAADDRCRREADHNGRPGSCHSRRTCGSTRSRRPVA